jgi:hypothetical protein
VEKEYPISGVAGNDGSNTINNIPVIPQMSFATITNGTTTNVTIPVFHASFVITFNSLFFLFFFILYVLHLLCIYTVIIFKNTINLTYGKHYHPLAYKNQCKLRLNISQAAITAVEYIKGRGVGFDFSSMVVDS